MSVRFLFRDFILSKTWNAWTRNVNVGYLVKRYRRDRSVREVFLCFRQAFSRPRGTLLLSATAACQAKKDEDDGLPNCSKNITDEELESLLTAFDGIEELSQTIFCPICNKRLVIDRRLSGIKYCICPTPSTPTTSDDGWEPYVEAEDTIIWRKEYKVGQGLYAYKVYGRYKEVLANSYAAVNVDTAYRKQWDSAVADLSVVERSPTVPDQAVIHWEVLWPRLFANRDYVYLRRHKEYNVQSNSHNPLGERPPPGQTDKPTEVSNKFYQKVCIEIPEDLNDASGPCSSEDGADVVCRVTCKQLPTKEETKQPALEPCVPAKPDVKPETQAKPQDKVEAPAKPEAKKPQVKVEAPVKPEAKVEAPVKQEAKKPEAKKPEEVKTEAVKTTPITPAVSKDKPAPVIEEETTSVHSNAKRKSLEQYSKTPQEPETKTNKVYVILSKSCAHPKVPETRNAIRVTEYWSQMVVRSTDGANNVGMEFVLTYYDEPAVGGMPSGVSAWASGRAAPAYLDRMRDAAKQYDTYRRGLLSLPTSDPDGVSMTERVSYREPIPTFSEQDMESSKRGPELIPDTRNGPARPGAGASTGGRKRSECTQTDVFNPVLAKDPEGRVREGGGDTERNSNQDSSNELTEDKTIDEEPSTTRWKYPFYFFT